MATSTIGSVETILRSAAIGQLLLFSLVYLRRPVTGKESSLLAVAVCTAGYLFLAMPLIAPAYGIFRSLFLVLTDALPYAIWLSAMYWLKDGFRPVDWKTPVKIAVGLWAAWHVYFFGVRQGSGAYHDLNHAIAILLMLHVIYIAIFELADDLVELRRKLRMLAAIFASLFIIFIAIGQLFPSWINPDIEGAINAAIVLAGVTLLTASLLTHKPHESGEIAASPAASAGPSDALQAWAKALRHQLDDFMATGGYRQSGLTIKVLADQLACPEHQLRQLINGTLGFRNFSAFLNAHRVREARARLLEATHEPVLTIALALGYGSIGPFNRAFKAETGLTPTEYRRSFQNRP